MIQIPDIVCGSLLWWVNPNNLNQGRVCSWVDPVVLTTDASSWGWGANVLGYHAQGKWSHSHGRCSLKLQRPSGYKGGIVKVSDNLHAVPCPDPHRQCKLDCFINSPGRNKIGGTEICSQGAFYLGRGVRSVPFSSTYQRNLESGFGLSEPQTNSKGRMGTPQGSFS